MSLAAFLQGILGASSLLLGAILGVIWQPSRTFSAAIMAFGSGTLLSAIAFEITTEVYKSNGLLTLVIGFMTGGAVFTLINGYLGLAEKGIKELVYLVFKQDQVC